MNLSADCHVHKYRQLKLDPNVRHSGQHAALMDRFVQKVHMGKRDECWVWLRTKNVSGYGMVYVQEFRSDVVAHRVSWMLFRGPIPEGMDVLHKCDNPACVNPNHLWIGTNSDNNTDAGRKGRFILRGKPGATNPRAKFTNEQVRALREMPKYYGFFEEMAAKYGVNKSIIRKIYYYQSYKNA